jgi:radical SAM-linked protein
MKFISHLDIVRLWQRAFRRAGIPLAYSEGFNLHPRISLAAPLALGVTSETELMDVFTTKLVSPHIFEESVNQQLPSGMGILQVYLITTILPSLQSQIRYAEYRVKVETEKDKKEIEAVLASLLSKEHLPWQHQRDTGFRSYDLRALVDDLWLISWCNGYCTIGMRLRCDSGGAGRPEQVAKALGFSRPHSICRSRLVLKTS